MIGRYALRIENLSVRRSVKDVWKRGGVFVEYK